MSTPNLDECNVCAATTYYVLWTAPDGTKYDQWICPKGHGKWLKRESQPDGAAYWKGEK